MFFKRQCNSSNPTSPRQELWRPAQDLVSEKNRIGSQGVSITSVGKATAVFISPSVRHQPVSRPAVTHTVLCGALLLSSSTLCLTPPQLFLWLLTLQKLWVAPGGLHLLWLSPQVLKAITNRTMFFIAHFGKCASVYKVVIYGVNTGKVLWQPAEIF